MSTARSQVADLGVHASPISVSTLRRSRCPRCADARNPNTLEAGVRAVLEGRVPGTYFVGQVEHERVAQLMVTYEWSDWRNSMVWWIQSVWVTPEARRRGYYGQLYCAVQAEARAAGAGGLRLYVDVHNTRAQAVYTALGMNGDHYRVFEAMERF